MLRAVFKLTIVFSAIGFVLASGAFAEAGPAVTFVNPTEGATVTDAAGGAVLDFTDNFSVGIQHCKLDDAPYADCTSVQSGMNAMRNGSHRYYVKSIDDDGDLHIEVVNFTVNDVTPPAFTVSPVGGSPVTDRPRFELDIVDAFATVLVSIGDRGPERFTMYGPEFTWSPEWMPNGTHDIKFQVVDPARNISTQTLAVVVDDTTSPTITLTTPGPGETIGLGAFAAEFSTDDPEARYTCSVDSAAPEICFPDNSIQVEGLADGAHQFSVNALDSAGNASSMTHSFTIDTTSVAGLSIATPANGTTYTAEPLLDLDSTVPLVDPTLRCSVNGGVFKHCAESEAIDGIDHNGSWTVAVRAEDTNGDTVHAETTFTVADTTGPTVSIPSGVITVPDVDQFFLPGSVGDVYSDGSASSNVDTRCAVDGAALTDCISAVLGPVLGLAPTVTPGLHTVTVQGTDWVGNVASGDMQLEITDTTGPTVEILSPVDASTVAEGGLTIDYRTSITDFFADPTLCQVDSEPAVECGGSDLDGIRSWSPVGLTPGAHTITVSRTDVAGNVGIDSISITVTDSTGPAVSIVAPSDGATLDDRVGLIFATDEKVTGVRCAVDSAAALAADSEQCETFSDDRRAGFFRPAAISAGSHELWIEVADVHGNVSQASIDVVVADTTAPEIRFDHTDYGDGAPGTDSPREISFSSTDLSAAFTCSLDSGAGYACGIGRSSSTIAPLANGSHAFEVTATDPSGNASSKTLNFTVSDVTGPPLAVTGVTDGMAVGSGLTVNVSSSETGAQTSCAVNSGAFSACGLAHAFSFGASGTYTLRFRATDVAGNATNRIFSVTATVPVPPADPPTNPTPPATPALAVATAALAKPKSKVTKKTTTISFVATVNFPASVDKDNACIRRATVKVHVKKKQVGSGSAPLKIVKGKCTISGKLKVKTKAIAGKKFTLGVTYAGNALVMPFYTSKQGSTGRTK